MQQTKELLVSIGFAPSFFAETVRRRRLIVKDPAWMGELAHTHGGLVDALRKYAHRIRVSYGRFDLESLQPNSQPGRIGPGLGSRRLEGQLAGTAQRGIEAILNGSRKDFGVTVAAH